MTRYDEAAPIRLRPVGAWLVEDVRSKVTFVYVVSQDMPVEEVLRIAQNDFPQRPLRAMQVWTGRFRAGIGHMYAADGRWVDTDGNVGVGPVSTDSESTT